MRVRIDCAPPQSAIFAFSGGNLKIVRVFALYVRIKGTGDA